MTEHTTIEPIWIEENVARAVHERQLAEHGGLAGIRDAGLLQSALAHIYCYRPDCALTELAAAYGFGVAKNHPFLDGNKRTALALTDLFLVLNGFEIIAPPIDTYTAMIALAGGEWAEEDFARWLKKVGKPRG